VQRLGRNLHSFTLELNLTYSRTHSWVKLGYTVDRRAQVELNSERVYATAPGPAPRSGHVVELQLRQPPRRGVRAAPAVRDAVAMVKEAAPMLQIDGRGLHSSTFQLNLSLS